MRIRYICTSFYQIKGPLCLFIPGIQFGRSRGETTHMMNVGDLDDYPQGLCRPKNQPWEDSEEPQGTLPISGCVNSTPYFWGWRGHDELW